jgi:hypothetical protein
MKKILMSLLLLSGAVAVSSAAKAQVRVGVNINIGDQPDWGPSGYDYAEYYYLPDIESYYYVPRRQFVYLSNGHWIFSASLPPRYANYDLYSGYKVVLREHDAYRNFNDHRARYAGYRNYNSRQPVRHDNGNHNGWYKNGGHDNDRGNGRGRGHGHGRGHD